MGNYESLAILLFIALMVYIFDRKNFTREGIVFLRRTKKGLEMIDRAAKKHPRLITFLADAGIVFSFGLIGLRYLFIQKNISGLKRVRHYATYLLIFTLVSYIIYPVFFLGIIDAFKIPAAFSSPVIFILIALTFLFGVSGYGFMTLFFGAFSIAISTATGTDVESSIKLVLPIDMPKDSTIPVFYVPITEWLISILFILIVHEFSHAIVARVEGIKVKSLGYGFFGPLPLGFAEPDEKEIKKSSSLTKTRIFGAGSFSNILAAVILLIIFITTMTAGVSSGAITFNDNGLIIASVDAGMPAGSLPNTTIGSQLTSVDGINITNISEFVSIMGTKNIGDNVTL
ncbi:MAG: site-2 protease family protein, partial [Candidatus Aenigmarchaeota archaeon]|nr:site-2 protease family protein [Candidatus Aenigmarchaeota archaeon]